MTGWGETISLIDAVPAVFARIVAPLASAYTVAETAPRFLDQGFEIFKITIGVSMATDVALVEASGL